MFGKKQKNKTIADGGLAENSAMHPSRRVMSDIMPARSAKIIGKAVAKVAVRPVKPTESIIAKTAPIKAVLPPVKPTSSSVFADSHTGKEADIPQVNVIRPPKAGVAGVVRSPSQSSGDAPVRHGGKFDFLTRQPIESVPKLPERPSFLFQLRAKFAKFNLKRAVVAREESTIMMVAEKRHFSFKLIAGGLFAILILAVGGGFFIINAFASLAVNIVPRTETVAADKVFKVFKEGGDVAAEVLLFTKTVDASKETTGKLDANSRAHGRIVIYNAYSKESQQLVRRTRFETPDGKIYRLIQGVTIPGTTTKNGALEPGSIEVEVEADQPGEDYNIGLTDFTIPGFKGTARYTKFYGRSKTVMIGGSMSQKRVVSKADIDDLKARLAGRLEEEVVVAAKQQVPDGFILLDDAYSVSYGDAVANPPLDGEGDVVAVSMIGEFRGLLIKKELLAEAIAEVYGKDGLSKKARVENIDELTIRVVQKKIEVSEMSVGVSGNARFVWNIDEDVLKNDFLSKKPIAEIFSVHEGIERAEVVYSPSFWHFVPKNKDKIHIRIIKD